MKKCIIRAMGIVLTAGLVITSVAVQKNVVSADAVTGTSKYIAFGADLNAKEKAAVLDGFGITESDLSDYKTIEITNKMSMIISVIICRTPLLGQEHCHLLW